MATANLTAQRLREVLHFDQESNTWTRIKAHKMRPDRQDMPAGSFDNGYLLIRVDGVKHKAHRLAWLWHYGHWPTGHIDHIDGNRANNRIENLRDVPRSINAQNQKRAHNNSSHGFLGVSKCRNKFMAKISLSGKRFYIGTYSTPEAAYAAYISAKRTFHKGNTL